MKRKASDPDKDANIPDSSAAAANGGQEQQQQEQSQWWRTVAHVRE